MNWELNSLPVPAEILVYTLHEWKQWQKRNDKFTRTLNKEVV
jgi:hypothetical protein